VSQTSSIRSRTHRWTHRQAENRISSTANHQRRHRH